MRSLQALSFALCLLAAQAAGCVRPLAAAVELSLPAQVAGRPAEFVTVEAKTPAKALLWLPLDPGLSLFPMGLLKDQKTAVVLAARPGSYRLLAVACSGDEISAPGVCVVVVGEAPPAPPGPPGPLAGSLKAAYALEADSGKAAQKEDLLAAYRKAAGLAKTAASRADWWSQVEAAAPQGARGKLPLVQKAIAARLKEALPADAEARLDEAARAALLRAVLEVQKALEELP
jgi:hypothetical protein